MCEYCGCQAVTAIATLTAEHDEVVVLLGRARAALDGGDVPAAVELACRVAVILAPHTAVEERGLFPALAQDFPDHVDRLAAEHRAVEAVLAEAVRARAAGVPVGEAWPARLEAATTLLRGHILAEQDGVFPAALAALSVREWTAVDGLRAEVGSALDNARAEGLADGSALGDVPADPKGGTRRDQLLA